MANGLKKKKSPARLDHEIDEVLRMRERRAAAKSPIVRALASMAGVTVGPPGQAEYERREHTEAQRRLTEIRRQPLSDRKEAQGKFLEAMRDDPELVAERVGWLLNGSYGYGSQLMAKQVLANPRMNRSAALTQMIGAFEWMAPGDMVSAAWKKLTKSQQAALEKAVQAVIRRAETEE